MTTPLRVWILQTGEPLHIDSGNPRPMRAMNLANSLVEAGHQVTLYSSAFYHQEKSHRCEGYKAIKVNDQLEIRLIPSPGYQGHMGPKRLYDHWVMGSELKRHLDSVEDRPDVAFIGYPPIEVATVMGRWLAKQNIPYMLDVKDQWPLLFVKKFPGALRPFARIGFHPYYHMAKQVMKNATGISAMANGFLQWALSFAGRAQNDNDRIVPFSAAREVIAEDALQDAQQWYVDQGLDNDRPKLIFIGTHSVAFDIEPIAAAGRYFADKGIAVDFVICGDGPMREQWMARCKGLDNVIFPGWINKPHIEVLMSKAFAVLTPYCNTEDFMISVPNKVIDAFSYGMAIVNALDGEVRALLEEHDVGLHYDNNVAGNALHDKVEILLNDPQKLARLKENSARLYREHFEFNQVYQSLVAHLVRLAGKS